MLRLRLQRRGKKNYATYRVVVADQRAPIKGRFVADVGSYNPHTDALVVDKDMVIDWIGKGVQPSNTVHNLLVTHGLIKADKVTSWKPKKKTDPNDTDENANDPNAGGGAEASSEGAVEANTEEASGEKDNSSDDTKVDKKVSKKQEDKEVDDKGKNQAKDKAE